MKLEDIKNLKMIPQTVRIKATGEEFNIYIDESGHMYHLAKDETKFRKMPGGEWEELEG